MLLSLVATALWASCNVIDKIVVTEHLTKPVVCVTIAGFVGFGFAMLELLSFQVGLVAVTPLLLSALTGCLFIAGLYLYFAAISVEEVTRIVPTLQVAPVTTIILSAIFLGEILGGFQYAGIALILAGAITVSWRKNTGRLPAPTRAFWMILSACLMFGTSSVIAKYALNSISYWNFFFWSRTGTFLSACIIVAAVSLRRRAVPTVGEVPRKPLLLLAGTESINMVATFIISVALSRGYASAISAVIASQPVFLLVYALMLSRLFEGMFREEVQRSTLPLKLGGSGLIIVGFFLLGGI